MRSIKRDRGARIPIAQLSIADVERWYARLRRDGMRNAGIGNLHGALSAAFGRAVRRGHEPPNLPHGPAASSPDGGRWKQEVETMKNRPRSSMAGCSVILLLTLAAACGSDADGVRGSGNVQTEARTVSGFDSILLEGSGTVVVDVGRTESLTIEAEDNLLPLLTSDVEGSRLELRTREAISPTQPIVYTASAVAFEGISILGSGDLLATNVDCDSFTASVAGSGDLDVTGRCEQLDLSITGSADFDGEAFEVARADIGISGSGDVDVNASEELVVRITGSGDVRYFGEPTTDIEITGTGGVEQR